MIFSDQFKKTVKNSLLTRSIYSKLQPSYSRLTDITRNNRIKLRGLHAISRFYEALSNTGFVFFVDYGTLLGLYRDGRFVKNEMDIDIGIINEGTQSIATVERELKKAGFHKSNQFVLNHRVVKQSYFYNKIKFDVAYYDQSETSCYCYLFYKEPGEIYKSDEMFSVVKCSYSKIESVTFIDVQRSKIPIPSNTEKLLEEKYGTMWRVPVGNWVYWLAPGTQKIDDYGKIELFD